MQSTSVEKSQEKELNKSKSQIQECFQNILLLKERNWYEELTILYKERLQASKQSQQMNGITFDRKVIQIQEHFRWFVAAVVNTVFNQ